MESNFFSRQDLGGVNPDDFNDSLRYANLKRKYLEHIQSEITFLQGCITESNYGSWSTHLNSPMKKRIESLQSEYYELSKN
jgi:hypothetical protein